jgi:hypothetical protein
MHVFNIEFATKKRPAKKRSDTYGDAERESKFIF